jgi:hypothetical protein
LLHFTVAEPVRAVILEEINPASKRDAEIDGAASAHRSRPDVEVFERQVLKGEVDL